VTSLIESFTIEPNGTIERQGIPTELRYRPKSKSEYNNIVRSNDLLYSDHLTIIYAR